MISESASVFHGSFCASASCYGCSENIAVVAVIVPELKFRDVEMQILFADVVEGSNDTTLEDAPEALNRIGVDSADNIFFLGMIGRCMRKGLFEIAIARPLIGADQADFVRHGLTNENVKRCSADIRNDTGDNIALAANSADDDGLTRSGAAAKPITLVGMPVLRFASNESLVYFYDAAEFCFWFYQRGADFVGHKPSGFDRTKPHVTAQLTSAHSLFSGQNKMRDLEPVPQGLVGVFENSSGQMGEPIAVSGALFTLPMMARSERIDLIVATARAMDALRPAAGDQVADARILVADREHGVKLGRCELVNWLWVFHGRSSYVGGYWHV